MLAAGIAAEQRIRAMRDRDPAIAEWLDAESAREVDAALAARATGDRLLRIIRSFPGSPSVGRAAMRAIEIFRDEGRTLDAVGTAFSVAGLLNAAEGSALLQAAAEVAMAEDRRALAARLLQASGAPSQTVREEQARADWPMVAPSDRPLPSIAREGNPQSVRRIEGRLPDRALEAVLDAPRDRLLMVKDGQLVQLDSVNLQELWAVPIMDPEVRIIRNRPNLLLWEFGTKSDSVLTAVDPDTGEIRWRQSRIEELLPDNSRVGTSPEGARPDRTPFLPWRVETVPTDRGILLVRANGDAAMLDSLEGRTTSWTAEELLNRVYGVVWDGGLVHLWGIDRSTDDSGTTDMNGAVVSVDPKDGRVVSRTLLPNAQPRWVIPAEGGLLAVGTNTGLSVLDPFDLPQLGSRGWSRRGLDVRDPRASWYGNGDLVVVDSSGVPIPFSLADGSAITDRWQVPVDPDWLPGEFVGTLDLGRHRLLRYMDRLLAYDREGRLTGIDSIADGDRDRADWTALPADGLVVLLSRHQRTGRYLYRVHRLNPDLGLRIESQPFDVQPPERSYEQAMVIDGWLLLGSRSRIDAIPLGSVKK